MSGKTCRGTLVLTATEKQMLEDLVRSRRALVREAEIAKIFLCTRSIGIGPMTRGKVT